MPASSQSARKPKRQARDSRPARRSAAATGKVADTPSDRKPGNEHPKPWTFLTNHAHVLILLHGQPDLVLREVASRVGITERAVQRIVQDLEDEGFLRRQRVGRRNEYEVLVGQSLRHPVESHRKIGDLLKLMTRS